MRFSWRFFDGGPVRPAPRWATRPAWRALLLGFALAVSAAAAPKPDKNEAAAHWAFRPVEQRRPPATSRPDWVRNPIDAFLAAGHERHGLVPLDPAPPNVLLRRLYLDLVGVPPTPAELREFAEDPTDATYARIVERLLGSPRHGERWGRHWMDVWRYSDWAGHGAEVRESQPHIWRWRDWIIESLNADKPYDRMILEMLAADELSPLDNGALRATGFLARNWFLFNRNVWLEEAVEHTGKAFLGLTLNCAKCHDHKSDPLPQTSFYEFRAFFEPHDVRMSALGRSGQGEGNSVVRVFDAKPTAPTYVFTRGDEARPQTNQVVAPRLPGFLGGKGAEISEVALPLESYYPALGEAAVKESLAQSESNALAAGKKAADAWAAALSGTNDVERLRGAAELAEKQAGLARAQQTSLRQRVLAERLKYRLASGEPDSAARAAGAAELQAGVVAAECALAEAEVLVRSLRGGAKPGDGKEPTGLAEAVKKAEGAKEALSAARRAASAESRTYAALGPVYPQKSTGRRLALARWIASPENPLTARVAMNHLWMRHFGSPLAPTVFDFGKAGKPPAHPELLDWLAAEFTRQGWSMKAMHRLIVTSSAYRMKSSGGATMAGNEAKDRDNVHLWRANVRRAEAELVRDCVLAVGEGMDWRMGGPELDQGAGESSPRRSVYFRHAKEKLMEFTRTFDGPGVTECYRRNESIVPQQALALANSALVKTQSRRLARALGARLGRGADDSQFIEAAFAGFLGRPPTAEETGACRLFIEAQAALLSNPSRLTPAAVGEVAALPPSENPRERAKEDLLLVLFNHNDFISIR